MGMQITVKDKNDAVKAETAGREQAVLAWKGEYEEVSRSSLNQELKLMQKDGYFKVRGREMYELDEEKLNALL